MALKTTQVRLSNWRGNPVTPAHPLNGILKPSVVKALSAIASVAPDSVKSSVWPGLSLVDGADPIAVKDCIQEEDRLWTAVAAYNGVPITSNAMVSDDTALGGLPYFKTDETVSNNDCGLRSILSSDMNSYSLGMIFRIDAFPFTNQYLMSIGNSGSARINILVTSAGAITLQHGIDSANVLSYSAGIALGVWHTIVVTYDATGSGPPTDSGNVMSIYLNNNTVKASKSILLDPTAFAETAGFLGTAYHAGASAASSPNATIWDKVLSADEIAAYMAGASALIAA